MMSSWFSHWNPSVWFPVWKGVPDARGSSDTRSPAAAAPESEMPTAAPQPSTAVAAHQSEMPSTAAPQPNTAVAAPGLPLTETTAVEPSWMLDGGGEEDAASQTTDGRSTIW